MFEHSSRYGPRLKLFLKKLRDDENPHVDIIIRTKINLEPDKISQLKLLNAEIRTIAGNIITLLLPARNITKLAQEDFVVYIELTRPLYPE